MLTSDGHKLVRVEMPDLVFVVLWLAYGLTFIFMME